MVWTQILLNMKIALINWNFQEREKNAWRNQSWANCQFPNFCPRKLDFGKERLLERSIFEGCLGQLRRWWNGCDRQGAVHCAWFSLNFSAYTDFKKVLWRGSGKTYVCAEGARVFTCSRLP